MKFKDKSYKIYLKKKYKESNKQKTYIRYLRKEFRYLKKKYEVEW